MRIPVYRLPLLIHLYIHVSRLPVNTCRILNLDATCIRIASIPMCSLVRQPYRQKYVLAGSFKLEVGDWEFGVQFRGTMGGTCWAGWIREKGRVLLFFIEDPYVANNRNIGHAKCIPLFSAVFHIWMDEQNFHPYVEHTTKRKNQHVRALCHLPQG